jgi:eukaryotic-like serine/threonine-protein kinase
VAVQGSTRKACIECGREFDSEDSVCPSDGTLLTPLTEQPLIGQALVGQTLGDKYEIIDLIGDGGMGSVYKARHKLMKRIVAIKTLHPHLVASASALKRFQQEAQAASSLSHPNVLAIHDFGLTDQGIPYLVMDYLEGVSLASVLQQSNYLELTRALDIFMQTCAGLYHAHQKGVVHRDLKPGNIMLVEVDGVPDFVKIVDFGIAKLMPGSGLDTNDLTQTGQIFGSPLYMSPEQCRAVAELDGRADIYSMGCVMYRSITGMPPFVGNDQIECMYKHVHETPAPFDDVVPELHLPDQLEVITFKAMAKGPADRYQTMNDLREALAMFRQSGTQFAGAISRTISEPAPVDYATDEMHVLRAGGVEQKTASPLVVPEETKSRLEAGAPRTVGDAKTVKRIAIVAAGVLLIGGLGIFLANLPATLKQDKFAKYLALGQQEFNAGDLNSAEGNLKLATAEMNPAVNNKDPRYATSLYLLGQIEYAKGQYNNAKHHFQQSQAIRTQIYGSESAEVSQVLTALGRCYTAVGEYDEAEPILKKALGAAELVSPPVPLQVADSLSGLGDLAIRESDYKSADKLLRRALSLRQKQLGNKNVLVATSMNDLGQACQLQRNFSEAESLYKSALTIWDSTAGAQSAQKANTLVCLGALYASNRQISMASDCYTKAMKIQEEVLGKNSPALAQTKKMFASLQKNPVRRRTGSFQDWLR